MKTDQVLHVSCALIENDGRILVAQRGKDMKHPGKWEFPGGKIEPGETAQECLLREIFEELSIHIEIKTELPVFFHHYPYQSIALHPFVCSSFSQKTIPGEHQNVDWILPGDLPLLNWVEADIKVWKYYLDQFCKAKKYLT
jgi:8-oxo-dGTP diphosphatase